MIETGRAIELGDNRRKLRPDSPLVGATAGGFERVAPAIPPARDEPGERLDNQDAVAIGLALQQSREQRITLDVGELVEREGREDRRPAGWQLGACDVAL